MGDRDFEYAMIDGVVIRVHQQARAQERGSSAGD